MDKSKRFFLVLVIQILAVVLSYSQDLPDDAIFNNRIVQIVHNIPDHGMFNSSESAFDPQFYQTLEQAYAIPSDGIGEIGSNEWLFHFVSGNEFIEDKEVKIYSIDKYRQNQLLVRVSYQNKMHDLILTFIDGEWYLSDFDAVRKRLEEYISRMNIYYCSYSWYSKILQILKHEDLYWQKAAVERLANTITYYQKYNIDNNQIFITSTSKDSIEQKKKLLDYILSELDRFKKMDEEERKENAKRDLAQLKKRVDKVENMVYYYNSLFTHYNNSNGKISLYIEQQDNQRPKLILKISYSNFTNLVYFSEVVLSNGSSRVYVPIRNLKRDSMTDPAFLLVLSTTMFYTWMENEITEEVYSFLSGINPNDTIYLRIKEDKTNHDFTLSETEKQAIQQVLSGYSALMMSYRHTN